MKKFFQRIGSFARHLIHFAVRVSLEVFYYVALFPVCFLIGSCTDLLDIKGRRPRWIPRQEIKDTHTYLHSQ